MKDKVGVVHGRFQLLHNDHVRYIMSGLERCEHLLIGICRPDGPKTCFTESDPHRSCKASNPFSYYERVQMIKGTLLDLDVDPVRFDIVPFPIDLPEMLFGYVPADAQYYLTIYDGWGIKKKEILEGLGCTVEILRHVGIHEKGISATDVRQRILAGTEWESFVPPYVYRYVIEHHLDEKVRKYP